MGSFLKEASALDSFEALELFRFGFFQCSKLQVKRCRSGWSPSDIRR